MLSLQFTTILYDWMEFRRKRGPVSHIVCTFDPAPFFFLLSPPPLTQQPSLLCERICLQNSIKMVQCSNSASSTTSIFSSLLQFTSLLSPPSSDSDSTVSRESVGFQEVAFTCYQLQHSGHQLVLIWSTEMQLLHVSISNTTLMYTRVHMFQSMFSCYHFLLQSPHSCHKAPPTNLGVTLRPKKVTKWRRHTKREKPTKIHCTFN